MDGLAGRVRGALAAACGRCGPGPVALSGGLDSSIIAHLLPGRDAIAVASEDYVSTDLAYSQMAASHAGMRLALHTASTAEMLDGIEGTVRILGNFNDIEIRNSVVMWLAARRALAGGHRSMVTGDGADELFAGYSFLVGMPEDRLEAELSRVCSVMHFPGRRVAEALGLEIECPFLDPGVVRLASEVPASLKVGERGGRRHGKMVLRRAFEGLIPDAIAWRPKSPMQDGAGTAGLTGLFEAVMDDDAFAQKREGAAADGVRIRSKESMHYYEVFCRVHGRPGWGGAEHPCPYCGYEAGGSRFCRMCGAFPV